MVDHQPLPEIIASPPFVRQLCTQPLTFPRALDATTYSQYMETFIATSAPFGADLSATIMEALPDAVVTVEGNHVEVQQTVTADNLDDAAVIAARIIEETLLGHRMVLTETWRWESCLAEIGAAKLAREPV